MTLREKQSKFAVMAANLILEAWSMGFDVTLGEAYRSPEEAKRQGFPKSLHTQRLAIDLNLFKDGVFLTDGAAHIALHNYWDSKGGAKRIMKDLNHYSVEHGGVR